MTDKVKKTKMSVSWVLVIAAAAVSFFCMYYADMQTTTKNGLLLIDCILKGQPSDFYKVSGADYPFMIYIFFSIWNLPVYLLSRVGGIPEAALFYVWWSKGIVLLFLAGTTWKLDAILKKMATEAKEGMLYIWLSSLFMMLPLMSTGQYDIIELFFLCFASEAYLKDGKMTIRTLIIFAVAMSVKYFVIFPFAILLLLDEKRLSRLFLKAVAGCSVPVIMDIPMILSDSTNMSQNSGFQKEMLISMFRPTIMCGSFEISTFLVFLFSICIMAYITKTETIEARFKKFNWYVFFMWSAMFSFKLECYPYWIILILPHIVFLLTAYKEYLKLNLCLEICMELSLVMMLDYRYPWVFFHESLLNFPDGGNGNVSSLADLADKIQFKSVLSGVAAVYFVCWAWMIVINNPWKKVIKPGIAEQLPQKEDLFLLKAIMAAVCPCIIFCLAFVL